jgi:hypothetical protein
MVPNRSTRQRMKLIATVILLACIGQGVIADDQTTPSPTPVYLNHFARPGSVRRAQQIGRQRALQAQAEKNAEVRAQAKVKRRSTAATEAHSKAATRSREQAQRRVDAEARLEAARKTPQATSDLMKRMGFSEQETAAQKTREDSAKPEAKETTDAVSQAERQPEQAKPATDSGSAASHPTLSHEKANRASAENPTSASPAPDSGSR